MDRGASGHSGADCMVTALLITTYQRAYLHHTERGDVFGRVTVDTVPSMGSNTPHIP